MGVHDWCAGPRSVSGDALKTTAEESLLAPLERPLLAGKSSCKLD